MDEIAEIVCKVGVNACDERSLAEVAVETEHVFPEQKIAERVGTVLGLHVERPDDVAEAFRHLRAVDGPPSVYAEAVIRFDPGGVEDDGPVYGVLLEDVLGDQVRADRPVVGERLCVGVSDADLSAIVSMRVTTPAKARGPSLRDCETSRSPICGELEVPIIDRLPLDHQGRRK